MPTAYALVHEENGVFGVSFPDFPGCVTTGRTTEEAIRKGTDALSFHVAGMVEDGEALPTQRTAAQLRADPVVADAISEGGVLALVPYESSGRAVRINISIDEHLLESIDRAAEEVGQSRSAYLADAVKQRLRG